MYSRVLMSLACSLLLATPSTFGAPPEIINPLDDYHTFQIQKLVQVKVIERLSQELNDTKRDLHPIITRIEGCKEQVNATIDQCRQCIIDMCKARVEQCRAANQGGASLDQIFVGLVNLGLGEAGSAFTNLGNTLNSQVFLPVSGVATDVIGDIGGIATQGGSFVIDLGKNLGNLDTQLEGMVGDMGSTLGNILKDARGFFTGLGNDLGGALGNIGGDLGGFFGGLGGDIGGGFSGLGRSIGGGLSGLGRSVGGLFGGRRRRAAGDVPTCESIAQTNGSSCAVYKATCQTCQPLLSENSTVVMSAVCGAPIVDDIVNYSRLLALAAKIQNVYNTKVKGQKLVTKVEYNPTVYDGATQSFSTVYVTALGEPRYRSAAGLKFSDINYTGMTIYQEIWDKLMA